ncbi:MAG: replication-associated recombination protein A [Oscillospiraceae bacterium]|nr:replication-associated recombination protein A [Oscillospiraceae bacterium]MDD7430126.1 replication-associated recombination protein A [Oscillospiraceae bacterium]MDY2848591.1 replication-associated recombination protein A [Oscillospiraceae bacterium]
MTPLADRLRPETLDDVVGQRHLLAPGKPLRRIIDGGNIPNMIFYGPSGVGKTTVARIIAHNSGMKLHKLNGTSAATADIREVIADTDTLDGRNGVLLYLDEIQYLNKKQQQSLLEYIENGQITLIASTTENPYFYIYNAILSRSAVFEFKTVSAEDIVPAVNRAFHVMSQDMGVKISVRKGAAEHIARSCGGDVRKSVSCAELCVLGAENNGEEITVTLEEAKELAQRSNMHYDRDGDSHYDILSALQKSIRGSDENAAIHYAARLIESGDIISLCRRLLVIAAEDIGLAYPQAIPIVKACVDSALQLGLPEARIPLANAVILLATAPKSNSAYMAINTALEDIRTTECGDIPRQLQNKHYDGEDAAVKGQFYKYPHDYPNHYVEQQYLPDPIKDRVYYKYGDNKSEQAAYAYNFKIKGK